MEQPLNNKYNRLSKSINKEIKGLVVIYDEIHEKAGQRLAYVNLTGVVFNSDTRSFLEDSYLTAEPSTPARVAEELEGIIGKIITTIEPKNDFGRSYFYRGKYQTGLEILQTEALESIPEYLQNKIELESRLSKAYAPWKGAYIAACAGAALGIGAGVLATYLSTRDFFTYAYLVLFGAIAGGGIFSIPAALHEILGQVSVDIIKANHEHKQQRIRGHIVTNTKKMLLTAPIVQSS